MGAMRNLLRIIQFSLVLCVLQLASQCTYAGNHRLTVRGDEIMLNGQTIKVIGLRCSNALISETTTNDLIAALSQYT